MSEALLPSNAGPATRAYAAMWDSFGRYGSFIGTIKHIGITIIPDDWVPWFIWDYGLEDVIPYVRDYRRVLAEGPEWQRTRGTDRGIEIGIGWVESEGHVAPPDGRHAWWKFQIAFTEPVSDLDQIQQLDGIIRLSKSAEDELFRMYSPDYDHRPVRMDEHRMDDGGWMDGYSGVVLWPDGPLVSFGKVRTDECDVDVFCDSAIMIVLTNEVSWWDGFRFDRDRLDDGRPSPIFDTSIEFEDTSELLDRGATWPHSYPRGGWQAARGPQPISIPFWVDEQSFDGFEPSGWGPTYPRGSWATRRVTPIPMEPT